jgi:hypothetical protein
MQSATDHDPLGVAMRDQAAALALYWESRWRAHPKHERTMRVRNAWRGVVRALEDYYELPHSFESRAER